MLLNLNADLGESFGPWNMGDDKQLLNIVDSANIACGFHAGDPRVMTETIQSAQTAGVSIGAHPGFPDLQGFGRRSMSMPMDEVRAMVLYQLSALDGMSRCTGLPMTHVKPHGALNNMACENLELAGVIVSAVKDYDSNLIFLAPALSELAKAASIVELSVAVEIFADRAYTDAGTLVPRSLPGAVLQTAEACITQVESMIDAKGLVTQSGKVIPTPFHSICVHGDNNHAVDTARQLRNALLDQGHQLASLPLIMTK